MANTADRKAIVEHGRKMIEALENVRKIAAEGTELYFPAPPQIVNGIRHGAESQIMQIKQQYQIEDSAAEQ